MIGHRGGRAVAAVLAAAVALVVSACSGVPLTSTPQVIGAVGGPSPIAQPPISPASGLDPRSIVRGFLQANISADVHHTGARSFLTADARNRWSDTTVTIVDIVQVSIYDPRAHSVTVTGRQIGALDSSGVYTPVLTGSGTGGDTVSFSFGMRQVDGQWRIATLRPGLIISNQAFEDNYQQEPLYFFNNANSQVVPDPRYTALGDDEDLATWLVTELADGPRTELASAVNTAVPTQTGASSIVVTYGAVTTVEVPGSSHLDDSTRNQLAAQLALTLKPVIRALPMAITDGGHRVPIQAANDDQFTASVFDFYTSNDNPASTVYYVRDGAVVDGRGHPVAGGIGSGQYDLKSVALGSVAGSDSLLVAGLVGPAGDQRLWVGSIGKGLRATSLRGQLSRPSWVPFADEVWIGSGSGIVRATSSGTIGPVSVSTPGGGVAGRITALRLSPEGSRVAMVLTASNGTAQVLVGSVVRSADQVRVDSLAPITPLGVVAADVAWNDENKLYLIGRTVQTGEWNVFEVQVDGSLWTPNNITNLPQAPDSITVAQGVPAWVSAGGTVWTQRNGAWASPGTETTFGTDPVYVE